MLDGLKRRVREWEAEGRHPMLTRGLTTLWMQAMNLQDFLFMHRVKHWLGATPDSVADAVEQVCTGPAGRAIRPMQVPGELCALIEMVAGRKPKVVVEIGTARGGTLSLLCRYAASDAVIISVDLPYGRNGGGYPRWKEKMYRRFAQKDQTLHLLRADSHDPATLEEVRALLPDLQVEFLLIDADHSYDGVKTDYDLYAPLVIEGGVIAIHDALENTSDPSIDVNRFWDQLAKSKTLQTDMIVQDPTQGSYGFGLVFQ